MNLLSVAKKIQFYQNISINIFNFFALTIILLFNLGIKFNVKLSNILINFPKKEFNLLSILIFSSKNFTLSIEKPLSFKTNLSSFKYS